MAKLSLRTPGGRRSGTVHSYPGYVGAAISPTCHCTTSTIELTIGRVRPGG
jgi:hypothetical protein